MILPIEIRPVDDAFLAGTLEMPHSVEQIAREVETGDSAGVVISVMLTMVLVVFLTNVGKFVKLVPKLSGSLINKNISFNLEHNDRSVRARLLLAFLLALPLCLEVDNNELFRPSFLEGAGHVWRSLFQFAALIIYFLLRKFISRMPRPRRCSLDAWKSVSDGWLSNFVISAILTTSFGLIVYICKWPTSLFRVIATIIFAFFFGLSILKNFQILREYCSVLGSILYLCALEIIPTAALVALGLI